ncbi:expressed unknown protein [Seminavis robusta]|uniref:Uncharacterized protein n=1 Tax=Seminavis robusta TaxID=568900 RepID=A0A9N8DFB0_9STRA|nr:expressed unknown protein [Seminavis robusta]|eukprot:Sro42_g025610.1 n/a (480) ;mRNA; f:72732-74171
MEDRALAEQLEGLMNLLAAVGISAVDNREMKKASVALKNYGSGAPIVFPSDVPEAKQLNDDQIEAMILKLQQAQAQAPQLMEALEDYVGQKNGGTSNRGTKKRTKKKKEKKGGGTYNPAAFASSYQQHTKQHLASAAHGEEVGEEEDEYIEEVIEEPEPPKNDHDDYDEDEEDDDFDEDADYPMVGPGVSDDCSVVSDMTTPTVVSSIHVNDEEQYEDMLPSMYLAQGEKGGPPLMIQPPKRKNLVSKVGAAAANRGAVPMRVGPAGGGAGMSGSHHGPGGAAAKRRQTYQQTMSKLHQNPYGTTIAGPAVNPLVPVEGGEPLAGNSAHGPGEFAFNPPPEGWQPFSDPNGAPPPEPNLDGSGRVSAASSGTGKPKKKGTKKTTTKGKAAAGGAATKSPKAGKKKKAVGSTTIDRDGFLTAPPPLEKKGKDPNGLSKSQHSSGTKKKVVKKKVVKKSDSASEGRPKKSPTNKAAKEQAR